MNFTHSLFWLAALSASTALAQPGHNPNIEHLPRPLEGRRLVPISLTSSSHLQSLVEAYAVEGGGFVLTNPQGELLGYSTQGSFRPDALPEALCQWLQAQADNVEPQAAEARTFSPVDPLLGNIQWSQDTPYNDLCPRFDLTKRCPTGCVATAMAQVMRYWQWPLQGVGAHTYAPVIMAGDSLSANFATTTYQWADMLPSYKQSYTEQEATAVATLMLHCGVAVDMVYYESSGANDYDVPNALISYFDYDRGIAHRHRPNYSITEWYDILEQEFSAGRPVLAYGRSSSGGHAFLFDGIDAEGLIHVNWGWAGMSDGYFRMTDLTPMEQGIGGSDGGYNYSQSIITGIQPHLDLPSDYDVQLISSEGLSTGKKKVARNASVSVKLAGKVTNCGWRDSEFDYALLLLSAQGDTVMLTAGPTAQTLAKDATQYAPSFGQVTFDLEEGDYTLYPACRQTGGVGRWSRIRDSYIGYPNYLRVHSDGAQISFTTPDYFDLKVLSAQIPELLPIDDYSHFSITLTNQGDVEYHGEIRAQLCSSATGKSVATSSGYIIDLLPEAELQLSFSEYYSVEAGSYYLVFVNDDNQAISAHYPVTLSTEVAAIEQLSSDKASYRYYNLMGQRLSPRASFSEGAFLVKVKSEK